MVNRKNPTIMTHVMLNIIQDNIFEVLTADNVTCNSS